MQIYFVLNKIGIQVTLIKVTMKLLWLFIFNFAFSIFCPERFILVVIYSLNSSSSFLFLASCFLSCSLTVIFLDMLLLRQQKSSFECFSDFFCSFFFVFFKSEMLRSTLFRSKYARRAIKFLFTKDFQSLASWDSIVKNFNFSVNILLVNSEFVNRRWTYDVWVQLNLITIYIENLWFSVPVLNIALRCRCSAALGAEMNGAPEKTGALWARHTALSLCVIFIAHIATYLFIIHFHTTFWMNLLLKI